LKKNTELKKNLAYSQKRCLYSLEITFVLRFFKSLSALLHATASNIEKMVKKHNFFSFLKFFSKVQVLEEKFELLRLIKLHKKKKFVMVLGKFAQETEEK
jgi:hypothetical protein